jgi:hypothetical protein
MASRPGVDEKWWLGDSGKLAKQVGIGTLERRSGGFQYCFEPKTCSMGCLLKKNQGIFLQCFSEIKIK